MLTLLKYLLCLPFLKKRFRNKEEPSNQPRLLSQSSDTASPDCVQGALGLPRGASRARMGELGAQSLRIPPVFPSEPPNLFYRRFHLKKKGSPEPTNVRRKLHTRRRQWSQIDINTEREGRGDCESCSIVYNINLMSCEHFLSETSSGSSQTLSSWNRYIAFCHIRQVGPRGPPMTIGRTPPFSLSKWPFQ